MSTVNKNDKSFGIKNSNGGFSLLELVIVIAIMAVLITVLTPNFLKYVYKSQKNTDMVNAQKIGQAFLTALVEFPDANRTYETYASFSKPVSATVNGHKETYSVYGIMTNKPDDHNYNGAFWGTMSQFIDRSDGSPGLYTYVNNTLGISRYNTLKQNAIMIPRYSVRCDLTGEEEGDAWRCGRGSIDRWRICKRVFPDGTSRVEVWAANNDKSGDGGGYPIYRVWPEPDDVYTK